KLTLERSTGGSACAAMPLVEAPDTAFAGAVAATSMRWISARLPAGTAPRAAISLADSTPSWLVSPYRTGGVEGLLSSSIQYLKSGSLAPPLAPVLGPRTRPSPRVVTVFALPFLPYV